MCVLGVYIKVCTCGVRWGVYRDVHWGDILGAMCY